MYITEFSNISGKNSFYRMASIRQILQTNHGIPWPKTFQSFQSAEEKNKIICKRKRVLRYFVNNFTTADVTSALALVDVVWIRPWAVRPVSHYVIY